MKWFSLKVIRKYVFPVLQPACCDHMGIWQWYYTEPWHSMCMGIYNWAIQVYIKQPAQRVHLGNTLFVPVKFSINHKNPTTVVLYDANFVQYRRHFSLCYCTNYASLSTVLYTLLYIVIVKVQILDSHPKSFEECRKTNIIRICEI